MVRILWKSLLELLTSVYIYIYTVCTHPNSIVTINRFPIYMIFQTIYKRGQGIYLFKVLIS